MPALASSLLSLITHLRPLAAGLVTGLALAACAPAPTQPAGTAPTTTAKPSSPAISPEAQTLLAQAEKDVQMAREQFALWTTAEMALKQAWEAAHAGDSLRVIQYARRASGQVRAGLAQLSYPGTELK